GHVPMKFLVNSIQVGSSLGIAVRRAIEVKEGVRAVLLGLQEIVEFEAELLGQLPDGGVALIDQFSAVLGDLALVERVADGPAAASNPVRGFVHLGGIAGLL